MPADHSLRGEARAGAGKTLAQQLSHEPYPEVASALRSRTPLILKAWRVASLEVLPRLADESTIKEFENDVARILDAAADSLDRDDAWRVAEVLYHAPKHGADRFAHKYPLADLLMEHRLLRSVIILELEEEIQRSLRGREEASLHAILDVIFQSATKSHTDLVNEKFREAARSELRLLSFYNRDLSGSLLAASSQMEAAAKKLRNQPGQEETARQLGATAETVRHALDGLNQLVTQEQLRRSAAMPRGGLAPVLDLVMMIVKPLAKAAADSGTRIDLDIDAADEIETDPELLTLVLENLISNAITHCGGAPVRITAGPADGDRYRISVADGGPGIAMARLERIAAAFERGEALSSQGVGVELALASQAAKLLGARVEVETKLGAGTVFHVLAPGRRSDAGAT